MTKWFVLALALSIVGAAQAAEGTKKGEGKGEPKGRGKVADVTKEQFVAQAKKAAEAKGQEFNKAQVEDRFDKMDKNKDGILTADERPQPKAKGEAPAGKQKKKAAGGE